MNCKDYRFDTPNFCSERQVKRAESSGLVQSSNVFNDSERNILYASIQWLFKKVAEGILDSTQQLACHEVSHFTCKSGRRAKDSLTFSQLKKGIFINRS